MAGDPEMLRVAFYCGCFSQFWFIFKHTAAVDSEPGRGTVIVAELPVMDLGQKNGANANSHTAG